GCLFGLHVQVLVVRSLAAGDQEGVCEEILNIDATDPDPVRPGAHAREGGLTQLIGEGLGDGELTAREQFHTYSHPDRLLVWVGHAPPQLRIGGSLGRLQLPEGCDHHPEDRQYQPEGSKLPSHATSHDDEEEPASSTDASGSPASSSDFLWARRRAEGS